MKKSYLNSESKTSVSLQPSKAIRLLLMVLFFCSFGNVVNAANISSKSSGNWSSPSTWVGGVVPSSSDNVTINNTVNVDVNVAVQSVNVIGTLIENTGIVFTVGSTTTPGSFTVGGTFSMGSGSDHSTLIVYGNYINNGASNFWMSDVIITGNLSTPSTSKLQNNGNVIVGGNISGTFDLNGGTGTGQIYAVNPNATVDITSSKIDKNVIPGVFPSSELSALITLVNQVIYGGTCSFTITGITNVSVCSGSDAMFTTSTNASSPVYQWQVDKNNGSGWVNLTGQTSTTLTVVGVTFSMNNYKYRAQITGVSPTCTKNSDYGVLTVNALLTAPTASATKQPTCADQTGTITITAPTGTGMTYSIDGSTYTNSLIFTSVAAGTYNVTVKNASGCISNATTVTINPLVTNTWTVTGWSNNTPTGEQNIIFNSDYAVNTDVVACSCQVSPNNNVTILSGKTLTITNDLTVKPKGVLTFEDKASLVQLNNASINSGDIIYKRKTTSVLSSDFTYWSSPVANQQLINVSSSYALGMFYSYNDFAIPENWEQETATTVMLTGKGYIIRGPQITLPPAFYDATFTGIPNNGIKTISIGATGTSNLLGNPYPSAINADLFLAANSSLVEGTIYLWTHNTAIQLAGNIVNGTAGSGAYAYTSDDYASYNTTGGVATGNFVNGVQQTSNKPTGKIAAAQSFFTTSKAAGTVTFNNSMRVSGNNTQFFKTKKSNEKTTNTIEKNRVWLNLTNTQGAFKQTLVGYITDATNDYDSRFDGESFDGNEFVDFYSVNQDKNLTIQGRALPFDDTDEVPLGFKSTIDGAFTINIDQVDGSLTNQAVFIEDKLTNTVTDLKSGNYTFNTVAGTFNERFVLKYTNKTLVTANFGTQTNKVLVSNKNKELKVNSFAETIDRVSVYDLLGRQIYQKDNVNSNEFLISNLVSSHQTLVVKTTLQNGKTVTDKIIY